MILVDTSGWIEYLRGTESSVCQAVEGLLDDDVAICDAVSMEVLAGARDERHLGQLRALLARTTVVPTTATDFDEAAALYRACRHNGETVRRLIDCLIAAVAIRTGSPILHADGDFTALARHTPLTSHAASAA